MVLTDKQIRKLALNNQLISPFNEANLQSESYDVTIGSTITTRKKEICCLDIADKATIENSYVRMHIPPEGYLIAPKEYAFVSLAENINLPENIFGSPVRILAQVDFFACTAAEFVVHL